MTFRILILFLCFCATGHSAETVGLLSLVSGNVQILRAGENAPVAARTADLVGAGDHVMTGPKSEAGFLFCPEFRAGKILADSEVHFDPKSLRVAKGKLGEERKVPSCRLPANLTLASASKMQSGMMRLRGANLLLLAPSHISIATLKPRFRWNPVDSATGYDIKLMDREEKVLWRQNVTSPEVQYSGDSYALVGGQKYWWRVTARGGEEVLAEAGSFFQVLPNETAEQVRVTEANLRKMIQENPTDTGPLFLLAFLCEEHEMLDEAVRVYAEVNQKMGQQIWVQNRLTELMNKLGWDKLQSEPFR